MASKSVAFLHFCARAGVSQKDKIEMITKVFCLSFAKQTSAHLLKVVLLFASFCLGACGGSSGAAGNTLDLGTGTQLQVLDLGAVPKSATAIYLAPDWWRGAFMQIYVRAYQDTDGDGKGDLKGLIQRLDYLQGLGVKGLWLLPITESSDRDHVYAVKNYRALEADYGSHADFDLLLSEAHKRGMGVILDFVINHSSNQHPLFLNSSSSAKNAQRDYFIWQTPKPTGWQIYGQDPWYASNWANGFYFAGFTSSMPDFNLRSSDVETFHHDNLRFWLNKGVDGFRFDAVGNLIENGPGAWEVQAENHVVMSKVRQTIMQYSQRFMVCEAPANSNAFAQADSCGSAFAFDLSGSVVGAAKGDTASIQKLADYYKTRSVNLAPFVSNHDSFAGDRLWNQVQGNLAQYKMAAASYLLLPGTPFIYYGEEIGMASSNALSGDAALRTPMSWTADAKGFSTATPFRALSANVNSQNVTQQQSDSNSLYQHYKQLLALRNTQLALRSGTYEAAWALQKTMGFQRVAGAEKIMVVLNFDTQANALNVSNLTPGETWSPLLGTNATASVSSAGVLQLNLPAQSFAVFKKN
jgi:glycosidase